MIEALNEVQTRVTMLQQLLGVRPPAAGTTTTAPRTNGTQAQGAFAQVLDQALSAGSVASGSMQGLLAGDASTATGDQAVDIARKYTGVPYAWGGTDPATGLDCSGLTQLVYSQLGVDLPRVSRDQARVGTEVPTLAQAQPGDLVFYGSPIHHVGIYIGDGKMIDAPHTGSKVGVHKVDVSQVSHIRRVLTSTPAAGSSSSLTGPYADIFATAGARHGVDPALLSAVAKAESGYRPNAVSGAGAQGLMQLMPATASGLGVDPLNPAQAADGAARLLAGYLRDYDGRIDLALAAYNAGPGAVKRYGGVPPYGETQTYVRRVTDYWEALR